MENEDEWPDDEDQYDFENYGQEANTEEEKNGEQSLFENQNLLSLVHSKDKNFVFFTMNDVLTKMMPSKIKNICEAFYMSEDQAI